MKLSVSLLTLHRIPRIRLKILGSLISSMVMDLCSSGIVCRILRSVVIHFVRLKLPCCSTCRRFYDFHCGVDVVGGFEEVVYVEVLVDKFFDVGMAFSIVVCVTS